MNVSKNAFAFSSSTIYVQVERDFNGPSQSPTVRLGTIEEKCNCTLVHAQTRNGRTETGNR